MLRKKTSAIRYNKNYNHNFKFMGGGVVGSGGGCLTLHQIFGSERFFQNLESFYPSK